MRKLAYYLALPTIVVQTGLVLDTGEGFLNSLVKVFVLPMIGIWLLALLMGGHARKPTGFHYAMIAFMLWSAATYYWSVDEWTTLYEFSRYLSFGLFTLALWDIVRTEPESDSATVAFLLGGAASVFAALLSFLHGQSGGDQRFTGAGMDPNDLALYAAVGIPVAWNLATHSKHVKWPFRLFCYAYPLIALGGIVVTASRGATLACLPGLIYIVYSFTKAKQTTRYIASFAVLFILVAAATSPVLAPQFRRIATLASSSKSDKLSGRQDIWAAAWDVYGKHPFLGAGLGGVPEATRRYAVPKMPDTGQGYIAHNTYLEVLTETGIPGILLYLGIIVLIGRALWGLPPLWRYAWLASMATFCIGVFSLALEARWQTWVLFAVAMSAAYARRQAAPRSAAVRQTLLIRDVPLSRDAPWEPEGV